MPMTDITNPKLIYAKGLLFLLAGVLASGLLIAEHPSLKVAVLLVVAIWCFARAYYFAFYVIEHYVDESYHFSGLWSFGLYLFRRNRGADPKNRTPQTRGDTE
jgi:hypothetical protein